MTPESRIHELITLKTIAETLNQSNELEPMLHTVLEKLLQLTGLSAAWIFLSEGYRSYTCAADSNLPPALTREDKAPMRCGTCWCLDRYWDGRLKNAVNILTCKRLEDAVHYQWGVTSGITHHATVPLRTGDRLLGVLNIAAPGKNRFTDDELALLQAVAFQIGGIIERMRLYQAEQRRADRFARLGDLTRSLNKGIPASRLPEQAVQLIGTHFPWPVVLLFTADDGGLTLRALYIDGHTECPLTTYSAKTAGWISRVISDRTALTAEGEAAFPARLRERIPTATSVRIADHGRGFAKPHGEDPPSYGLSTMRERTELLGGRSLPLFLSQRKPSKPTSAICSTSLGCPTGHRPPCLPSKTEWAADPV